MKQNMFFGASAEIFKRAEELRERMTHAEQILWNALRINEWHLKFRRQHPLAKYIVDFYCHAVKLVIELDGDVHDTDEIKKYDEEKDRDIKDFGLTLLRFKNEEVINNINAVLKKIKDTISEIQKSSSSDEAFTPPSGPAQMTRSDGDGGKAGQPSEEGSVSNQIKVPGSSGEVLNPPSGDGGETNQKELSLSSREVLNPPLGPARMTRSDGDGGKAGQPSEEGSVSNQIKVPGSSGEVLNPPSGDGGKTPLFVIKIGGNIIDDESKLQSFLKNFASVSEKKILIHGGGKLATHMAQQLNIPQQLIDGRRITDAETLKVITMVYAGYINKNIVALLQSHECNAVGLCGADGNLVQAHKRVHPSIDYGLVGDIDAVNSSWLQSLLEENVVPVIAPVSNDKKGQLLNTNADTIAQEIAKSMADKFEVTLMYCFEKKGVLSDASNDDTVIKEIRPSSYKKLKEQQVIHSGMIPKLDNAFAALDNKVKKVVIGKAEELIQLISGTSGTSIVNE